MTEQASVLQGLRLAVPYFLTHACNGFLGRPESDPVAREVTEFATRGQGRDKLKVPYSSCGDEVHWMYWRCGFRLKYINREERKAEGGTYGWHVGANITRLVQLANDLNVLEPRMGDPFDAGDALVIWNRQDTYDSHAIAVTAPYENNVLPTSEYGQPGGKIRLQALHPTYDAKGNENGFTVGTRKCHVWLPLGLVLEKQLRDVGPLVFDMPYFERIAPPAVCSEVADLLGAESL